MMKTQLNNIVISREQICGDIEGFPIEIVKLMLQRQFEHTGKYDISVLQECRYSTASEGGFNWDETIEDFNFWNEVLCCKNFHLFFEKYPQLKDNFIDPYGIENVNFTLIDKDDDRWNEYKLQRLERGFDNSELWNLDTTIAKFIYPRLKVFSENIIGIPCGMTEDTWKYTLDSMVKAFELIINGESDEKENQEIISKGLDNFRNYFFQLWN